LQSAAIVRAVACIPAAALIGGAATGLVVAPAHSWIAIGALIACACAGVWAWCASRPLSLMAAVLSGFFAGGILLGAGAWQEAWRSTLRTTFESLEADARISRGSESGSEGDGAVSVVLTGVLRMDAARGPNGVSIALDARSLRHASRRDEDMPVRGGVLLTVVGDLAFGPMEEWRAGRTLRIPAQLRRPTRYLNPGVPDAERSLARRGTALVGVVKSGALVETVARGGRPSEAAAAARAFARRAIHAGVGRWSERSAGIVTAIVIGDRSGLDGVVRRRLQEAGTYHVIAISGGNIAILAGLVLAAFRVLGVLGRAAMVIAGAGLIAYAWLVGAGGGASVERATLMAVVYFAGRTIDLRGLPMNALAVVAMLIIVDQPLACTDPAFLLTCGATAGIIAIVPAIQTLSHPRVIALALPMLAASAAAEAAVMPIGAVVFSRVTFAGLLLNFAAIPLMAVAQIAGIAIVPATLVLPAFAPAIGWIAHLGAEGLVQSADLVRWAPALTWRVAAPHWLPVAVYYGGLVTGWMLWRRGRARGSGEPRACRSGRLVAGAAALGAALWIVAEPWTVLASRGNGRLRVTFLDVGQGDSALVRFPRGATLLVDAGGLASASGFDVGDRVVAPVLRHVGIRRLSSVLLTHAHPDHMGGLPSVIGEFRPWNVWEGIPVPPSAPLQALMATAAASGATWVRAQTHDRLVVDDIEVSVRHPGIADWERQEVRNDDSIVLELRWRDVSIVLTGDVGREVEGAIAPLFQPARLRVLKAPHHGSLTSSSAAFLHAIGPRVVVVSAGRGNPFGHPAPAVLARYREVGAQVFRTDRDGAVTLETDGRTLDVHTFAGRTMALR
jgi:competence protein ComEC